MVRVTVFRVRQVTPVKGRQMNRDLNGLKHAALLKATRLEGNGIAFAHA